MERRRIDPYEYASSIAKANACGILLTTKADDEVNTMVIAWGLIGTLWGRPTFTAFVRTSRHTHDLLGRNPEFTINVPLDRLDKRIFSVAGTKSGRHVDKVSELGLTLEDGRQVSVPAIAEAPITLECKVVYRQMMDQAAVSEATRNRFYPADVTDVDASGSCYYHEIYYAEIVDSYVLE